MKIVLDGKRPITEAGEPDLAGLDNVAGMMVALPGTPVKRRTLESMRPPGAEQPDA